MNEDRRKSERRRVLRRGRIVFRKGHSAIDCVLMNLSDHGACLRGPAMLVVPKHFELRIENGPSYDVETAHRSAEIIGVRFVGF